MNLFYAENAHAGGPGSFPAVADGGPDDSINVVIAGAATATSTSSGMAKGLDLKPSVVEASTMVKVKVSTRFNMIFKG